jgi:hypothetical protein
MELTTLKLKGNIINFNKTLKHYKKVKQYRYRPGVAQRVPGN